MLSVMTNTQHKLSLLLIEKNKLTHRSQQVFVNQTIKYTLSNDIISYH